MSESAPIRPLHLLTVWNPSYTGDALDAHLSLLLEQVRWRDAGAHDSLTSAADLAPVRRAVMGVGQEGLVAKLVRVGMRGR